MSRRLVLGLLIVAIIPSMGTAFAHGMSEADQLRAEGGGYIEFIRQGAVHMVTGYDHLLFLAGVLFFLSGFTKVVKFVTAFTLGHCITLIAATFLGIQANYFLVDAVIALTVCYIGFDNIGGFKKYFNMKSPHILGMVFIFGLGHGFGLSTRLQQLTIGEGWDLLMKILCFNLGVEVGQVFALTIILTLLAAWRHTKSFERFSMAANTGLIIIGAMLCLMQLHGYLHQGDPIEFFDLKSHQHAHEDLGFSGGASSIPAGMHVDTPGGTPHASHDAATAQPAGGHSHAASEGTAYSNTIDKIFDIRSGYKAARNAKTTEEIQAALQPIAEVQKVLATLRGQVLGVQHVDLAIYDVMSKEATAAAKSISEQAQEGDVGKISELIQRFDKNILAIEELVMHGKAEGYHVDAENAVPHKH